MPIFRDNPPLLARFKTGDPAALDIVYRFYAPRVTRFVRRRSAPAVVRSRWWPGGDPYIADLVHEVFVRAFSPEARARFDGRRLYGPYLYSIARNLLADHQRRWTREVPTDEQALAATADACHRQDDVEASWTDAEAIVGVTRYLASLSPAIVRVFEKRYVEELSQSAAASALGLTRQSLRTAEAHLKQGLRASLHQRRGTT